MKKCLKNSILLFVLCCCVFSLVSCSEGIKGSEAKAYINEFFEAVVAEDYSKGEEMLHPERPADLESFFLNIEETKGVDFQKGIEIERYTNFSTSLYDSTVDGSTYQLTMDTVVGEEEVEFTIEIVKNEGGYGIYNLILGD